MNLNEIADVTKEETNFLSLSPEELNLYPGFESLSADEQNGLKDLVYHLSVALYKTFTDGKS